MRRGFQSAEVPRACEGQVQRPWNGSRTEGQYIDGPAQQFELLFVLHAKLLLLVHDHQAQILEDHIRGDDPVGSDDDIHRTNSRCLHHSFLLLGRPETAHQFDAHRILRHALAEMVVVLLG